MCYRISHIWSLGEPVPFWNTGLEAPLSFPAGGAGTVSAPEPPRSASHSFTLAS